MKPYERSLSGIALRGLKVSVVIALASLWAAAEGNSCRHFANQHANALIRSADDHYYSLDYDKALHEYEKFAKENPRDPYGANQVLKTVIFRELYRLNLLDTTMYARDGFLSKTQPEPADPKVRERVEQLYDEALALEEARLRESPDDVEAIFDRGITRSLKSTYMAMIDKSYIAALKNALGARHDHERVLQLDSNFVDAKTIVGTHLYVIGSLPLPFKMLAGMSGLSGNKKKGLQYLKEVGSSQCDGSVDARVILALFLRRESQYGEALSVVQSLEAEHPKNFLFALEEANLKKDMGNGAAAADAYRSLLAAKDKYTDPHLGLAFFGLAEVLRGQGDFSGALKAYDSIPDLKTVGAGLRARALLGAGEMYDQLGDRAMATKRYNQVLSTDQQGPTATMAQRHLRHPFVAKTRGNGDGTS